MIATAAPLIVAAAPFEYLWDAGSDDYHTAVTYGLTTVHATAQTHDWLPVFEVFDATGRKVGERKTAAAAVKLLIKTGSACEAAAYAKAGGA